MQISLEKEAAVCSQTLSAGKLILYPTDTIWGIGCDATNEQAVSKVYQLKQRTETKSMIILLSLIDDIDKYVDTPDLDIIDYISKTFQPTTAIYENGKNVANNLLNKDGSIAIRITKDEFCSAVINKLNKPVVSTSANISGKPAPTIFKEIDAQIKNGVDYIVQHRQGDFKVAKPSAIVRLSGKSKIMLIRS